MNFKYNNKTDNQFVIEREFAFPSFSNVVQFRESNHSDFRRRLRNTRTPFTVGVPLIVLKKEKGIEISRDDLIARLNLLLYSEGPGILKLEDTNWYLIGEFQGPYVLPPYFDDFTTVNVEFVSEFSHKFYDAEKIQTAAKTVTISTKSQLPTIPLIELTGLTGTDVQVSISGDSFMRIRLTGAIPARLTIDIENERIYETNSGLNMVHLFRRDSAFEDFRIKDKDVVVLTNASETAKAKLTYKELLL